MNDETNGNDERKIVILKNGPYLVSAGIRLVRKTQVVSEHGEPIAWKKGETIPTEGSYRLCRCGQSSNKPFCDDTHETCGFDGTETADIRTTAERRKALRGGEQIVVRKDGYLCIDAGFCGNRLAGMKKLVQETGESTVRSHVIAMIERCPSGSLSYAFDEMGEDNEPDLPQQIALTTEMTSDGPIAGPLWVTGNIRIERSDGQPFESRNRVTLCHCGKSKNQPLCDGVHRELKIQP
jgi:CDGSH-type Zn-finger protein